MALTPFQTNFRNTAKRLINGAGESCTLKRVTKGVYDNATHQVVNTETDYPVIAYMTDLNWSEKQDPNIVIAKSQAFLVAAVDLPIEPKTGDYIESPAGRYRIVKIKAQRYSSGVAYWRLVGERG